jgi:hypothetical protein
LAPPSHGRRKIWEFDGSLHCSIIGTCLTNAELRQALCKLGLKEAETATEHDLRASGVLDVGGRPAQVGHLRALAARMGAMFLHHDSGVEERGGLLPGLVSGADAVLFPVDCDSHAAMSSVKRLCRQAGKPFTPLRSAGLAPFCAAIKTCAAGCVD